MLSGNLMQQARHTEMTTPVPGVQPGHGDAPKPESLFEPNPEAHTPPAPGDMWAAADVSPHTRETLPPLNHSAMYAIPVPSGIDAAVADYTTTDRMNAIHNRVDYSPDDVVKWPDPLSGRIQFHTPGRLGSTPSTDAFLVGANGYDRSNPESELYGGARYNSGTTEMHYGVHQFRQKQGQDAWLRGVENLAPWLPTEKPPVENAAPYTRPSSGPARTKLSQFRMPVLFSAPGETSISDYTMAQQVDPPAGSGFYDDGRM